MKKCPKDLRGGSSPSPSAKIVLWSVRPMVGLTLDRRAILVQIQDRLPMVGSI